MIERLADLTHPPVVGVEYLVPSVRGNYGPGGRWARWPVVGPLHDDPDFNFHKRHWHVDGRFLSDEKIALLGADYAPRSPSAGIRTVAFYVLPVEELPDDQLAPCEHPFVCYRDQLPRPRDDLASAYPRWAEKYRSVPCARSADGRLVCPHRGADLSTVAPVTRYVPRPSTNDTQRVVTCPVHGLKFDADSGEPVP